MVLYFNSQQRRGLRKELEKVGWVKLQEGPGNTHHHQFTPPVTANLLHVTVLDREEIQNYRLLLLFNFIRAKDKGVRLKIYLLFWF